MAEPFGDQDQSPGGAGKRPAATIEGTATELSVERADDDAASAEPESQAGATEAQAYLPGGTGGPEGGDTDPPPPRTSLMELKSFVTHLAAGLLGGLVGVVALAIAWGWLPTSKQGGAGPETAKLEERLAKLEAAPASSGDTEAVASLESRVKALEDRPNEVPPEFSKLTDRIAQLEATFKTMADAANQGGSVADAAAISQQISEAEQRLQAKIDAALADSEVASASTLQQMQTEIAELKAKIGALAEAELGTSDSANLQPEMAALAERIGKIESALPDLADAVSKDAAGTKSAAVAIAFANLRASVSEGRPYAGELATIGSLSPDAGDLGVLPAFADKGIPTLPELARSFETTKDAALAAATPAPDGSLLDGLLASAQSLVKIRRVDEAATGEGPGAVLARAEAEFDKGNLAETVKEVETLDGPSHAAFSVWLDQARARLGADETLKRLENILLVSVGGGSGAHPTVRR
jgi:hypothetical protein